MKTQSFKTALLALLAAFTLAFSLWDHVSLALITQPIDDQSLSAQQTGGGDNSP